MNRMAKVGFAATAAVALFATGALASPVLTDWQDSDKISDTHRGSVDWADVNGIVSGYPDGTFRPGVAVTRQQLTSLLHNYHEATTVLREGPVAPVPAGEITTAAVNCPGWWIPLSGAYGIDGEPTDAGQAAQISVLRSQPTTVEQDDDEYNGWEVRIANASDRDLTVQVSLVCSAAP